jgi:iodotyrosine deiodinase
MKFLNKVPERPKDELTYMIIVAGYAADGARVPIIGRKPLANIATFKE